MGVLSRVKHFLTRDGATVVIENTGPATSSNGGAAVTGYSGPSPKSGGSVTVKNTGPATASGPGSRSVSGIDYT